MSMYELRPPIKCKISWALKEFEFDVVQSKGCGPASDLVELGPSVRVYNGLKWLGGVTGEPVDTVEDVTRFTFRDLLKAKNMGVKSACEIKCLLLAVGLDLSPSTADQAIRTTIEWPDGRIEHKSAEPVGATSTDEYLFGKFWLQYRQEHLERSNRSPSRRTAWHAWLAAKQVYYTGARR